MIVIDTKVEESMTTYNYCYRGITAYVSSISLPALLHLHETLPNVRTKNLVLNTDESTAEGKTKPSEPFIDNIFAYLSQNREHYPTNTPDDYTAPMVEQVTINETELIRIYIPIVSYDIPTIDSATQAVYRLLNEHFSDTLVSVKQKDVTPDNYDFHSGDESILLSVRDR